MKSDLQKRLGSYEQDREDFLSENRIRKATDSSDKTPSWRMEITVFRDITAMNTGSKPLFCRQFIMGHVPFEVLLESIRMMFGEKAGLRCKVWYGQN